jgi:hypothetical protein
MPRKPKTPSLSLVDQRPSVNPDEAAILAYVTKADDDTLMCRQKHDLPPLAFNRRTRKLPKNVTAFLQKDGCWRIIQYCARGCGYYRYVTSMPGGRLDVGDMKFESRYTDPRYLAHGVRIPPRYCFAEMWRRTFEELQQDRGGDSTVPETMFSDGAS